MATINDLLENKDKKIHSIPPGARVFDAIKVLAEHNIGVLLVMEGQRLVGIMSERDVIREARNGFARLERITVAEIMTKDLIVGVPSDDISYVMAIMTKNRIRHLPILDGSKIVGLLSIGDVIKSQISDSAFENRMLKDYIDGKYPG